MRPSRSAAASLAAICAIAATALVAGCGSDGGAGGSAFVNIELGPDTSSERVEFEQSGGEQTKAIVIRNDSDEPQTVRSLELSAENAPQFDIVGGTCEVGAVLEPGATCDIVIERQETGNGDVDPATDTETVPEVLLPPVDTTTLPGDTGTETLEEPPAEGGETTTEP